MPTPKEQRKQLSLDNQMDQARNYFKAVEHVAAEGSDLKESAALKLKAWKSKKGTQANVLKIKLDRAELEIDVARDQNTTRKVFAHLAYQQHTKPRPYVPAPHDRHKKHTHQQNDKSSTSKITSTVRSFFKKADDGIKILPIDEAAKVKQHAHELTKVIEQNDKTLNEVLAKSTRSEQQFQAIADHHARLNHISVISLKLLAATSPEKAKEVQSQIEKSQKLQSEKMMTLSQSILKKHASADNKTMSKFLTMVTAEQEMASLGVHADASLKKAWNDEARSSLKKQMSTAFLPNELQQHQTTLYQAMNTGNLANTYSTMVLKNELLSRQRPALTKQKGGLLPPEAQERARQNKINTQYAAIPPLRQENRPALKRTKGVQLKEALKIHAWEKGKEAAMQPKKQPMSDEERQRIINQQYAAIPPLKSNASQSTLKQDDAALLDNWIMEADEKLKRSSSDLFKEGALSSLTQQNDPSPTALASSQELTPEQKKMDALLESWSKNVTQQLQDKKNPYNTPEAHQLAKKLQNEFSQFLQNDINALQKEAKSLDAIKASISRIKPS